MTEFEIIMGATAIVLSGFLLRKLWLRLYKPLIDDLEDDQS